MRFWPKGKFDLLGSAFSEKLETSLVRFSIVAWVGVFVGLAVLGIDAILPKPPRAVGALAERERAYMAENYFRDPCFVQRHAHARTADNSKGIVSEGDVYYVVSFPSSPLIMDGFSYRVIVRRSDRRAYVAQIGGFAGGMETRGPMSLAECLRPVYS